MSREPAARRAAAAPLLVALCAACSSTTVSGSDGPVIGTWGGEHARLTLGAAGGAIEYDCAHGTVTTPVRADGGRFSAAGFHVREHGGPVRVGEAVDSLPALYSGRIVGDVMTLRVVVGADSLGPFTLRFGATAAVYKCL